MTSLAERERSTNSALSEGIVTAGGASFERSGVSDMPPSWIAAAMIGPAGGCATGVCGSATLASDELEKGRVVTRAGVVAWRLGAAEPGARADSATATATVSDNCCSRTVHIQTHIRLSKSAQLILYCFHVCIHLHFTVQYTFAHKSKHTECAVKPIDELGFETTRSESSFFQSFL